MPTESLTDFSPIPPRLASADTAKGWLGALIDAVMSELQPDVAAEVTEWLAAESAARLAAMNYDAAWPQ